MAERRWCCYMDTVFTRDASPALARIVWSRPRRDFRMTVLRNSTVIRAAMVVDPGRVYPKQCQIVGSGRYVFVFLSEKPDGTTIPSSKSLQCPRPEAYQRALSFAILKRVSHGPIIITVAFYHRILPGKPGASMKKAAQRSFEGLVKEGGKGRRRVENERRFLSPRAKVVGVCQ
ncbi:hypothetical protein HAX54_052430 [Datura stramonium]|uniref:Uncharacterized protein n=1 Tax=Datura stramonium TaxID=4076 RepID=A0ABS8RS13_DATST|nr:hypothetical protein [Datura stramonium]